MKVKLQKNKKQTLEILALGDLRSFLDFARKIWYNCKQIARGQKKRFYFNVLKREKETIIKKREN